MIIQSLLEKNSKRGNIINLSRALEISSRFATDIAASVETYRENPKKWGLSPVSVTTCFSRFLPALPKLEVLLGAQNMAALSNEGLGALNCDNTWANLERACLTLDNVSQGQMTARAFHLLYSIHANQPDVKPPSHLQAKSWHSDVSALYKISAEFLLYYKSLVEIVDRDADYPSTSWSFKHQTYSQLVVLLNDPEVASLLKSDGLDAFKKMPTLLERVGKYQGPMKRLLEMHDPSRWRRTVVTVHGHVADLTATYRHSEKIFNELVRFGESLPLGNREAITARDSVTATQRAILDLMPHLSSDDSRRFLTLGFFIFTDENGRVMRWMYENRELEISTFMAIKNVVDALFPDRKLGADFFQPYRLSFANKFSDRPIYCDYAPVREISVKLFEHMTEFLEQQKATIDQQAHSSTTLYHNYINFKAALLLAKGSLGATLSRNLRSHGIYAFNEPGGQLQKSIFSFLQNAARTRSIATLTAHTYKSSVAWFIERFNFNLVEAYPIYIGKTAKHLLRLNSDDYYSAEQCRELAFHLESALADPQTSPYLRIQLLLGRILLKTGWNLSPTLEIECDDIVRTSSPLNPNGAVHVVLQKARAGYRTDAYSFSDPQINIAAIQSAAADLIYVRDELTFALRESLPESSRYRRYVFLTRNDNLGVHRLSMSAVKTITNFLERRGSKLTFDTRRIRKGGLNHLYRQVQKDLVAYVDAAKHDFATFQLSYYRVDENQSRYALGKAVAVMERYFSGKEISSDIVIVTEPNRHLQHTPIGECASAGDDAEATRYNKEHRRLHSDKGASARFCADFLSCVWCKFFRLVADPEHVWKLLSYREFVLRSMEVSVLGDDSTDDQQTHIAVLKERVADMLRKLDEMNPGVTAEGALLLRARGMHTDWTFALVDAPMVVDNASPHPALWLTAEVGKNGC